MHARGYRFRLHAKGVQGRPDLLFPKFKAAVFVHGCFWHRHTDCRYATTPATRTEFWQSKFDGNVARDIATRKKLMKAGWRVGIVWECTLRTPDQIERAAILLSDWLHTDSEDLNIGEFNAPLADN